MPVVMTREGFSSRSVAEAPTAIIVATKPPAACW